MVGAAATQILPDPAGAAAASLPCCGQRPGGPAPSPGARRAIASPADATYIERDQTLRPRRADKPKMLSPCSKVCTIEVATGLCAGCARTRAEIAAWSRLGEAERARIMRELPGRRRRAGPRVAAGLQLNLRPQVDG
jgi:predicted Fe-S protein YdhL (DUF1289 family)